MRTRVVDGAPVVECGLCGARSGDRRAMAALNAIEQASERGVGPLVWPLVQVLDRLPGLLVRSAADGAAAPPSMPFVELAAAGNEALVQIENLAKSLQLAAGSLHRVWVIEVEFQHQLVFVLRPRRSEVRTTADQVREANLDLEVLAQQFDSHGRLRWWRPAGNASR